MSKIILLLSLFLYSQTEAPPQKIVLKINTSHKIELNDNSGSTGYDWELQISDSLVVKVSKGKRSKMYPNLTISTYIQQYVFEAKKRGKATVTFALKRPWDKQSFAAETKTYLVVVK